MSVINRRNALFGWVVYQVGIRVIKQKAKAAVPKPRSGRAQRRWTTSSIGS